MDVHDVQGGYRWVPGECVPGGGVDGGGCQVGALYLLQGTGIWPFSCHAGLGHPWLPTLATHPCTPILALRLSSHRTGTRAGLGNGLYVSRNMHGAAPRSHFLS